MKNYSLFFAILYSVTSGFAQYDYFSPWNEDDYSWDRKPKDYNSDYYSNSWNKQTRHNLDNKETELYNFEVDHSENEDEGYHSKNHYWDDYHDHGQQYARDKECITPDGEEATCIPLSNCPGLKHYFYHHHYRGSRNYICGHTYSDPLVCCGIENKYNNNQKSSTDLPTVTNVPSHFVPFIMTPKEDNIRNNHIPVQQEPVTEVVSTITTDQINSIDQSTASPTIDQRFATTSILVPPETLKPTQITTTPAINFRSHPNFNLLPSKDTCGLQGIDDKIFGGNETGLNEFPWMVLLEYQLNGISTGYKCGGMLINDRYILTAAHCVFGITLPVNENLLQVRLGEHDLNTNTDCRMGENRILDCNLPPQDIGIEETIVHPGFSDSDGNMFNDIALLRLNQQPTPNDFIRPICLPLQGEKVNAGENLTISGWGVTINETTSLLKLKGTVPYINDDQCKSIWTIARQISDNQFCAGGSNGVSVCSGDSGGPIMSIIPGTVNWYAEGLVSYGRRPCGTFPDVFIRISSYINWILDNIRP